MNTTLPPRDELLALIRSTVHEVTGAAPAGDDTRLFGRDGLLDSLSLVTVVLDVEQQVNERYGLTLSLADEKSLSQQRSPFRSVTTLADYVLLLAAAERP